MIYILALLISTCLICGQASWGSAVKNISASVNNIGSVELITKLLQTPKFWLGAFFYGAGTILYFLLLSKVKFFSVQLTMTGLAIVFSVLISYFFFKENITLVNLIGVVLVLTGIAFVMHHPH